MYRILILTVTCFVAFHGFAYGQGLLDSVLGPGGLGLWGGADQAQQSFQQQWNTPQAYGGSYGPNQQQQQPPPPGAAGYPPPGSAPQGYGYPPPGAAPQGYGPSPYSGGVYSDWQNYQPGAPGSPPPVSYSTPPPGQTPQMPPQQYAPQAMPQQQRRVGAMPPTQGPQAPLRPGQYAPRQGPMDVDSLPPGATQITTTTPDGTTVQYYPPAGEPGMPPAAVGAQPRQARPRSTAGTAGKKQALTAPKTSVAPSEQSTTGIAMPKPVEVPPSQDPRSGWSAR